MRIAILDFETTGLDPAVHRVIELGAALWDTDRRTVVHTFSQFFRPEPCVVPTDITAITGITADDLLAFGLPHAEGLGAFERWCAAGGVSRLGSHTLFDRDFMKAEVGRCVPAEWTSMLMGFCGPGWIDTSTDLPFTAPPDSLRLKHLATDHGFINPMPHRALSDAITATLLFARYPPDACIARADSPTVLVQSLHKFDDNDKARALGFRWDRIIKGAWAQRVKACDIDKVRHGAQSGGFRLIEKEA